MLSFSKKICFFCFLFFPFSAPAMQQVYSLYEGEAPNTIHIPEENVIGQNGRIERVAIPQLAVYHPDEETNNGISVLICPGGGYAILAIEHEGYEIAKWYSQQGYTAAVLTYRLPDEELVSEPWLVPLNDARQGIRFLRERAEEWNYGSDKIGILGFSAGGHLASSVSVHSPVPDEEQVSSRPDFSILAYPVISMDTTITHQGSRKNLLGEKLNTEFEAWFSTETQVHELTPPAFLFHSWDDAVVPAGHSIRYARALNKHGIKTELHLFEKGGHGYGAGNKNEHGNAAAWLKLSDRWIRDLFHITGK